MELRDMIRMSKRVYVVGNGGSFANAQHVANDLEMAGVRAHTINPASLTRTANDEEYRYVFSRWIILHGEVGDLLIAMSGSGESPNIIAALEAARLIGMRTCAVVGKESTASRIADLSIVSGAGMQGAEEGQINLGHELVKALAA